MDLKAIDKLRSYAEVHWEPWDASRERLNESLDEIEQEIAERYIELPVDADGVPIHVGDVIQFVNEQGGTGAKVEVCAISKHYAYYGEGKHFYKASMCRHVNPRTIEDAISDALRDYAITDMSRDEVIAKYADDLRNMGVGE